MTVKGHRIARFKPCFLATLVTNVSSLSLDELSTNLTFLSDDLWDPDCSFSVGYTQDSSQ